MSAQYVDVLYYTLNGGGPVHRRTRPPDGQSISHRYRAGKDVPKPDANGTRHRQRHEMPLAQFLQEEGRFLICAGRRAILIRADRMLSGL